uniref:Resistance to inhibitors of cholinesterase protein 3 n=1 Tax=Lygus hesperus TaxID=30085 RepID=A0A0A9ZH74_LYGHE
MSDFTTSKSIFVLAIVAGCFAILWPNVFYPMFQGQPLDKIAEQGKHMHQERPPHLRPEFLHPALREKGRAIPQSHVVPKVVIEGRPGPIPGLRPPMGGAGHVVPPPKGGSTMGIVMPMYTIGIVVFFLYTMMKLIFKKSDVSSSYELSPDPDFGNTVFGDGCNKTFANGKEAFDDSKLGCSNSRRPNQAG